MVKELNRTLKMQKKLNKLEKSSIKASFTNESLKEANSQTKAHVILTALKITAL
jgi:hypothetical protein